MGEYSKYYVSSIRRAAARFCLCEQPFSETLHLKRRISRK
ncbi:hypothetical protein CSE45_4057 [Citreicella sp. SE45]|nr:hypothetical protein CSE45_4057 [Citreicella sp. SE45]